MAKDSAKSLVGLVNENCTTEDVLETFKDYGETAGISPFTVKAILDKYHLTREELDAAYQHMQTGMTRQLAAGLGIAGFEYLQSMEHVAQMIAGTMTAGDTTGVEGEDLLATIKSGLVRAYKHNSKARLEEAVEAFKAYAQQANPGEFGKGACLKGYALAKYGFDGISVYDHLMGIHATDDLQIAEAPAGR